MVGAAGLRRLLLPPDTAGLVSFSVDDDEDVHRLETASGGTTERRGVPSTGVSSAVAATSRLYRRPSVQRDLFRFYYFGPQGSGGEDRRGGHSTRTRDHDVGDVKIAGNAEGQEGLYVLSKLLTTSTWVTSSTTTRSRHVVRDSPPPPIRAAGDTTTTISPAMVMPPAVTEGAQPSPCSSGEGGGGNVTSSPRRPNGDNNLPATATRAVTDANRTHGGDDDGAARTHQQRKDLEPGGPNEEVLLEPNNEDVEVAQGEKNGEDSLPSHPAVGPTSKKKGLTAEEVRRTQEARLHLNWIKHSAQEDAESMFRYRQGLTEFGFVRLPPEVELSPL